MAHTDFSTVEHIGQWEDGEGFALVIDLSHPMPKMAEAFDLLDVVAVETLLYAVSQVATGEDTLDTINAQAQWAWLVSLYDFQHDAMVATA